MKGTESRTPSRVVVQVAAPSSEAFLAAMAPYLLEDGKLTALIKDADAAGHGSRQEPTQWATPEGAQSCVRGVAGLACGTSRHDISVNVQEPGPGGAMAAMFAVLVNLTGFRWLTGP